MTELRVTLLASFLERFIGLENRVARRVSCRIDVIVVTIEAVLGSCDRSAYRVGVFVNI